MQELLKSGTWESKHLHANEMVAEKGENFWFQLPKIVFALLQMVR